MLKISELTLSYGAAPVLDSLDAVFKAGAVHGIVGHNGAGKSSFFNVLAGIQRKNSGTLTWNGTAWSAELAAYLETQNYFYSRITGREYLMMFPLSNSSFSLDAFQEFFQLPLDELVEHYSTGMKKKLALLALLKQEKALYILDEPFNGLDLESNKVLEVTVELLRKKGKTVLISSHILAPLLEICDEVHWLSEGKIARSFGPEHFSEIDSLLFDDLKARARAGLHDAL